MVAVSRRELMSIFFFNGDSNGMSNGDSDGGSDDESATTFEHGRSVQFVRGVLSADPRDIPGQTPRKLNVHIYVCVLR